MAYDAANRLIKYNGEEVKYDADGNMIYGPLNGEMSEFVYDCRNRLVSAGGVTYGYDAENNRISKTAGETKTEYVIDTSNTLSHVLTATTGEMTTYYVFGIGLLYQEEDGETLFYHFNNIGSTEAVTDENGQIVETFAYGPYGELLSENKCGIMYLYNGEYGVATDENGLYYMRARYYNSEIKRFVNQDVLTGTISDSPTMNRYAYVNGNPISLADPFGLSPSINWNAAGHTALSFLGLLTIIPTPVTVAIGVLANVANALWYASEDNYFEALCCTVGALGGAYSFLKITGLATKSCVLTSVIKNSTAVGSIAMGGIDIAMVGYENYQKYVVRGEDFSWTDAALDTVRIVLDSTAIAAGLQLYSEPVPTCFVAGTLVATADGHVAIEEIQAGDMVLAGDPETGEVAYKEVTRTFVNESDELIHVRTNGEEIITTPTHPFYVNQFGWTHAADLRAGDVLVLSNGEYVVVEFIQHEILEEPVKVYNFEVEDFHTYFVGESSVLVHNTCPQGVTTSSGTASKSHNARYYTDDELITGANEIHSAQYKNNWWGSKNPICVTATDDGTIIVSKNAGIPGRKSRTAAISYFGNDVVFVGGRGANLDILKWNISNVDKIWHAEARSVQYMLSNGISTYGARQATTLLSCNSCSNLQLRYRISNLTGFKDPKFYEIFKNAGL